MAIPLGPRARTVLRYAGIALLGIITFVFAFQMSLPVDRAKQTIIEKLSPSYDVTIGSIERGIMPGRVYIHDLTLRTRPKKADDVPTTFFVPKLEVDVGIFALIRGNLVVDVDAALGNGDLSARITLEGFGKKGLRLHVRGSDMPGSSLPLRPVIGLPMTGKLDIAVDLDLPNDKRNGKLQPNWQKADGTFDVSCPSGCTFGDGKTKLKPIIKNQTQAVMVGDGIEFGKVNIDSLVAHAEMKGGNFDLTKFELKSQDGEVHLDYSMKLEPDLGDSIVTGCVRFKGSPELLKRDQKTFDAINLSGAELRSDGLFHITLTDRLTEMKRLNQECGPNVHHGEPPGEHPMVRPTITVMPPHPAPPVAPPPAAPPPAEPAAGSSHPAEGEPAQGGAPEASPPAGEGSAGAPPGNGGSAHAGEMLQRHSLEPESRGGWRR